MVNKLLINETKNLAHIFLWQGFLDISYII